MQQNAYNVYTFQDVKPTQETAGSGLNSLYNILCLLWNIHLGAPLPRIYSITNTKHWITYTNNRPLPLPRTQKKKKKKKKKRTPLFRSADEYQDTTLFKTGSFLSVINPLINDCGSCLLSKMTRILSEDEFINISQTCFGINSVRCRSFLSLGKAIISDFYVWSRNMFVSNN